jgi:hypothetical protein
MSGRTEGSGLASICVALLYLTPLPASCLLPPASCLLPPDPCFPPATILTPSLSPNPSPVPAYPSQCNAAQPQCGECAVRATPCVYPDTNASLVRRHADLSAVFSLLRSASEDQAEEVLRRIRGGDEVSKILQVPLGRMGREDSGCGGSETEEGRKRV